MQLLRLLAVAIPFIGFGLAGCVDNFANGLQEDQQPIAPDHKPIARTTTMTRTRYEINVVSTAYRVREHAKPTPHTQLEEVEQTLVFGVEGTGCDMKACTICRLLNDCSDEETECTGCDLAYYCNQCSQNQKLRPAKVEDIHVSRSCFREPGRSVPCDGVEEAIEERKQIFKAAV